MRIVGRELLDTVQLSCDLVPLLRQSAGISILSISLQGVVADELDVDDSVMTDDLTEMDPCECFWCRGMKRVRLGLRWSLC